MLVALRQSADKSRGRSLRAIYGVWWAEKHGKQVVLGSLAIPYDEGATLRPLDHPLPLKRDTSYAETVLPSCVCTKHEGTVVFKRTGTVSVSTV